MAKHKYFQGKVSSGFMAIYSSRILLRVAWTMLGLFLPIFLFELFGFNLKYVLIYYMIDYIIYGFFVPLGAMFTLNKFGVRKSILISTIWGVLYFLIFYAASNFIELGNTSLFDNPINKDKIIVFVVLSLVFLNLRRLMFWVPIHTDVAKFTDKKNRAKELSLLEATTIFLKATMPLVAGWFLFSYGYGVLFMFAVVIYALSALPLIHLPKTEETFSWSLKKTWKEFFSKKRRKTVLAFMGDGAENTIGGIIWPIFIFKIFEGNYLQVGLWSSLIVVFSIFLQLFIGKKADLGNNKNKVLRMGTILYAIGWLVKMSVVTAFHVFVTSTYHSITQVFTRAPFDALNYERAADQGHFVDEYTVIHEMAICAGRIFIITLILILMFVFPEFDIKWTFLFGAMAALCLNFLIDDHIIEQGRHSG